MSDTKINLNQLIQDRQALKQKTDELKDLHKETKEQLDQIDEQILTIMDDLGIQRTGNGTANVVISESVVASADSDRWEDIFHWIEQNNAWDLIQKRISAAAFRAYLEAGLDIPGLAPFTQRRLLVRAA